MITSAPFWGVLAIAVLVYWRLPRGRELFLVVGSATYIAYLDWKSAAWLLFFSTFAFVATQRMKRWSRLAGVLAILGVAAYLAYYKYAPPLVTLVTGASTNVAQKRLAQGTWAGNVVVPLGSSYFTFKLVHYVVECHRKNIKPHGFISFLAYMFFWPMFTAGPIERFDDFLSNRAKKFEFAMIYEGGTRIVYGCVKKFVLVDLWLGRHRAHDPEKLLEAIPLYGQAFPADDLVARLPDLHPLWIWQFTINHYVAWYLDFSAYCDIAIGLGLFFGVRLCENFDHPFLVSNIGDFWRRYHMSLSNWCQRYVYFPVLGTTRNAHLSLFASMTVMGLWHAGNLNYLAWGLYQATLLSLYLVWTRVKRRRLAAEDDGPPGRFRRIVESRIFALVGGVLTFLTVCASAAFPSTQDEGIRAGLRVFVAMFGIHVG